VISFITLPPFALFRFIYYITKLNRKQVKKKKNPQKKRAGRFTGGTVKTQFAFTRRPLRNHNRSRFDRFFSINDTASAGKSQA